MLAKYDTSFVCFVFLFYLNIFVEAFALEQKCSSRELTLSQNLYLSKSTNVVQVSYEGPKSAQCSFISVGVKRRLQAGCKMQTEFKMQTNSADWV